jgi:UDP-glucose 4-epimerase
MTVLVCGGAGYIGSHNVRVLSARGDVPVVIDNLQTGHRASLPNQTHFYEGDIRNSAALDKVFNSHHIDAVLHFAADALVGESIAWPLKYFNNNVYGMQILLEAMLRHKVNNIVFSSTCAVYGEPEILPLDENIKVNPKNPYGESKLIMERIMHWVGAVHGIRFVSLRYFNVGGAWIDGDIGEDHQPETHLIPIILQVPLGLREHITIFGNDYPTHDGTCIRDYLDIMDLTDAHMRALDYLHKGGDSIICNVGSGTGFSVLEMIATARRITGHEIAAEIGPRRPGDPSRLVASVRRAQDILGWSPKSDIESIIASAWLWHKKHPAGF